MMQCKTLHKAGLIVLFSTSQYHQHDCMVIPAICHAVRQCGFVKLRSGSDQNEVL